ncbi:hypothetical protein D3C73_1452790 [compost metagenome]
MNTAYASPKLVDSKGTRTVQMTVFRRVVRASGCVNIQTKLSKPLPLPLASVNASIDVRMAG